VSGFAVSPLRVKTNVPVSAIAPPLLRSTSVALASVAATVTVCTSSSMRFTVAFVASGSTR
jgi:hypothetical protein